MFECAAAREAERHEYTTESLEKAEIEVSRLRKVLQSLTAKGCDCRRCKKIRSALRRRG